MYKEEYMKWFADDADNFVNHYYDELVPDYVKRFLDYIDWFNYNFSEDFFNFHYDWIMEEDHLSDVDQERVWQASFDKRYKESCELSK